MRKVYSIVFFKILSVLVSSLVFVILLIGLGGAYTYYSDNHVIVLCIFLGFILASFLLFPITKPLMPSHFQTKKKVLAHGLASIFIVSGLGLYDRFIYSRSKEQFNYQLGNCGGPISPLMQTNPIQSIYRNLLGLLPVSGSYIIYTAEEACRTLKINEAVKNNQPKICNKKNKVSCLKDIFTESSNHETYSVTGSVLGFSIGTVFIKDERKRLAEGLSEAEKVQLALRSTIDLANTYLFFEKYINKKGSLYHFLPGFPHKEIERMPSGLKKQVSALLKEKESISKIIEKMDYQISEPLLDAYLLRETYVGIRKKFEEQSTLKLKSLLKKASIKLKENRELMGDKEASFLENELEEAKKKLSAENL